MGSLFDELSGVHSHTCKCDKCHKSNFSKDIIPQRKTLCPVDAHMRKIGVA
jgi:acetyl-CoA carboxylase beta subunit